MSGRRGSNSPPIAWKAIALPNELLPLHCLITLRTATLRTFFYAFNIAPSRQNRSLKPASSCADATVGRSGFEPLKSKDSGFTVRPIWPLWNLPVKCSSRWWSPALKSQIPCPGAPVSGDARKTDSVKSQQRDSNPRPADYKSAALPAELCWRSGINFKYYSRKEHAGCSYSFPALHSCKKTGIKFPPIPKFGKAKVVK